MALTFQKNTNIMRKVQQGPHPLFSYFLESVKLGSKNSSISFRIRVLQGPLCDFKVWYLEGEAVDCHLLALGTLSPFVLSLMEEAGGDCLILPDFGKSDILTLMNLVYSGE